MLNINKPKAILFDLDGTLLDTAKDLGNALNHVLKIHNMPTCEYDTYRDFASHGANGLLTLGFGEQLQGLNADELRQCFLQHYHQNICIDTCPFNGVEALIKHMQQLQIPWGIVTNKPGWLTEQLLPNFEIFSSCAVVVSGDTLPQRKPHPAPLLYAANKINTVASECWYVGDAERDIQAANAANMFSIAADYGYVGDLGSSTWGADQSIASVEELIQHLVDE